MNDRSPFDRARSAKHASLSTRFAGRASGTRRIVAQEPSAITGARPVTPRSELSQRPSWLRRWLDRCWQWDALSRGRLLWCLVASSAAAAGALPWLDSGARATLRVQLVTLLLAGILWVARCRPKGGTWQPGDVRKRLRELLATSLLDARSLRSAPKSLRLSIVSRWALAAGLAGLAVSSAVGIAAQWLGYALGPTLAGSSLWSASSVLVSALLGWALRVQAPPQQLEPGDLVLAASEIAPLVDLSQPLEVESLFLDPTLLHLTMEALGTWRAGLLWRTEHDHAAALQRHLWQTHLPQARLERGRWLGQGKDVARADLIVDDSVLIDVQLGLEDADVPRVAERVRRYRRSWGERPIVIVLCPSRDRDAPDAAALESLVALHAAAPVIVTLARR